MFPHLGTHMYVNKSSLHPQPLRGVRSHPHVTLLPISGLFSVLRATATCHGYCGTHFGSTLFLLMALCVEATYIEKLFAPGGRCGPLYTPIHIYMDVELDGIRSSNRLKSDSLSQFAYIHFACLASFFLVGILIVASGFDATPTYCNETFQGCQASRPRHRQARRCIVSYETVKPRSQCSNIRPIENPPPVTFRCVRLPIHATTSLYHIMNTPNALDGAEYAHRYFLSFRRQPRLVGHRFKKS